MTHTLAALLIPLAMACTTEAPLPKEPTKIYDFGSLELADIVQAPTSGASIKASLRHAIGSVQPALLACYRAHGHSARGTIALTFRLNGGPDGTIIEAVDVGGDVAGTALVDCIRDTAMTIEFSPMQEPAVWQVNCPFHVGA